MTERVDRIRQRLTEALRPESLEIDDESHLHVGHAGAADGRGHFRVLIVADAFDGQNRIQRHRLVYSALGDMMQRDIHALTIQAYHPNEI
jgi:BolA protein